MHLPSYCLCLLEVVDAGAKIPAEHWDELANLAEDHIVDVRLVAARCLAKVFATQQESTEAPPASIVRAARALKIDPSACVREELRNVNFSGVTTSLQSHVSASYEQSSDSSDDEDNTSPTSRNRASDTGKADLLAPSDRARSEEQANNQHTNGTFVHDSAITSDRMDNTAVTVQSNDREELEESEDEDDDYDNDNDSIDLDSSTIYDIDLGDLSASSTNLSTNSTIKPIVSSSHSSSNSRETPPLLPAGNGVLTPSRLAGTPAIRPCQIQRAGSASSWHFSMREEGQFVAIDIEGHA